ncbi:hypothetical protein SLEP1_g21544 [Rubroshorea leprosula]|uniref:Uncharacterized protein n=1 Tax=Rubroshorea leprosula TaxID=152421 RepID=A0AAV5JIB6_9ROSI|nr:hypothetical protein SLEP1_g21544 [Rubroshorea leprosula]
MLVDCRDRNAESDMKMGRQKSPSAPRKAKNGGTEWVRRGGRPFIPRCVQNLRQKVQFSPSTSIVVAHQPLYLKVEQISPST